MWFYGVDWVGGAIEEDKVVRARELDRGGGDVNKGRRGSVFTFFTLLFG